ncbi:MAG TPA: SdpI family protein [Pyrinomonadaceae bacterium]|jgi:uncharacterized membrane protein
MSIVTVNASLFALVGLLFVGLSVPLIKKRVPPNPYYGFRTKKTLSDPKIWYEANRVSGHDLLVAGALITITSFVMLVFAQGWKPEHVVVTLLSVMILSLVGAVWHGFAVLRRM